MWRYKAINEWDTISLHDCKAINVFFKNDLTVFEFDQGFWITAENDQNPYEKTLGTDKSQLRLKNCHCIDASIANQHLGVQETAIPLSWLYFCQKIALGQWEFEFITETHPSANIVVYEGCIWSQTKSLSIDCALKFSFDEVFYVWNKICPDITW